MASQTSVQVATPTPTEWAGLQNAQRAAKNFFLTPLGKQGIANVKIFQAAFNGAVPALIKIIISRGGKPDLMERAVPLDANLAIKVDGLYGPQTRNALTLVMQFSFPARNAQTAANEFMKLGISRSAVPAWAKVWHTAIVNMVAKDYAAATAQPQTTTPATVPSSSSAGQQQTQQVVDQARNPVIPQPGAQPTDLPVQQPKQTPVPIDEPAVITAPADSSYTWVWWVLGLAGVGGGLWYFFGKKRARA